MTRCGVCLSSSLHVAAISNSCFGFDKKGSEENKQDESGEIWPGHTVHCLMPTKTTIWKPGENSKQPFAAPCLLLESSGEFERGWQPSRPGLKGKRWKTANWLRIFLPWLNLGQKFLVNTDTKLSENVYYRFHILINLAGKLLACGAVWQGCLESEP